MNYLPARRDFYNNCVPGVTPETGPREPWHDCHAKVEGPIAVDLVSNFMDRVKKQGRESLPFMCAITEPEFSLKVEETALLSMLFETDAML